PRSLHCPYTTLFRSEGFSNETLWPAFHYFTQYMVYNPEHWEAYYRVNEMFCEAIVEKANPDDTIWVHDYQLMLLPKMLREALPRSEEHTSELQSREQ